MPRGRAQGDPAWSREHAARTASQVSPLPAPAPPPVLTLVSEQWSATCHLGQAQRGPAHAFWQWLEEFETEANSAKC